MERPTPSDKGIDRGLGGQLELAQKVLKEEVVTTIIPEDDLRFYLSVASETGFTIRKIAGPGEDFPALHLDRDGIPERGVSNVKVQAKGNIAVAIERPAGSKDHSSFWNTCNYKYMEALCFYFFPEE